VKRINPIHGIALAIVALNVLLRLRGIFQEMPPFSFCDEDLYTGGSYQMLQGNTWKPLDVLAGGVNYYLPILVAKLLTPVLPTPYTFATHLLVCRAITVIGLGTLMPVMVLFIGNRFVNQRVGVAAAIVATFSPMALGLSRIHYPDHAMTGLAACLLYFCFAIAKLRRGVGDYVAAGVILGIMASVKYTGVTFAFVVMAAHLLRTRSFRPQVIWASLYPGLLLAGMLSIGTFLACNPHVFTAPGDYSAALAFHHQHYATGHQGLETTNGYLFYAKLLYTTSFGVLGLVLYLLGLGSAFRHPDRLWLLIIAPIAFVVLLGRFNVVINRNLTPVLPMLFLSLGLGIDRLIAWVLSRETRRLPRIAWLLGLATLFCAEPLTRTVASLVNDFEPDSRVAAKKWITRNLPHGKVVGFSVACWGTPIDAQKFKIKFYEMPVRPATDCLDYYVMDSWFYSHYGIGTSPYAIAVYGEHIFRNTGGVDYTSARAEQDAFLAKYEPIKTFRRRYFGPDVTIYQPKHACSN
jgi:4-amino-4-deoxy-L-arabinose transferase-like glycosyltransferase